MTRQGFYAWKHRPPSKRDLADRELCERIRRVHAQTEGIYGSPRVDAGLRLTDGTGVGRKRVARLMRQLGLQGADGRRGGPRTTARNPQRPSAPDLVDRRFARASPNRLWVCDLKYIQTGQGFLFLAAVQDVYSRRIIGRSMRDKPQGRARTRRARDGRQRARPPKRRRCRAPRTTDPSTQASSTAPTPNSPESISQWDRSVTPGTTPSPKRSSRVSRKSCSAGNDSLPANRRGHGSSGTSNASTTPRGDTQASTTSHQPNTNNDMTKRPPQPNHQMSTKPDQLQPSRKRRPR